MVTGVLHTSLESGVAAVAGGATVVLFTRTLPPPAAFQEWTQTFAAIVTLTASERAHAQHRVAHANGCLLLSGVPVAMVHRLTAKYVKVAVGQGRVEDARVVSRGTTVTVSGTSGAMCKGSVTATPADTLRVEAAAAARLRALVLCHNAGSAAEVAAHAEAFLDAASRNAAWPTYAAQVERRIQKAEEDAFHAQTKHLVDYALSTELEALRPTHVATIRETARQHEARLCMANPAVTRVGARVSMPCEVEAAVRGGAASLTVHLTDLLAHHPMLHMAVAAAASAPYASASGNTPSPTSAPSSSTSWGAS